MSLRINDTAPDFTAETTLGTIRFHEWIGDSWAARFPAGWQQPLPYIRLVKQPSEN